MADDYVEKKMIIPIHDCGEPLVKIEGVKTYIDARQYWMFNDPHQYARQGVAERLIEAKTHLPAGLDLLVLDGFRTLYEQQKKREDFLAELKSVHYDLPEEPLLKDADKYTAKAIGHPPHTTGGALNVTLLENGREVFMGCFYGTIDARTPTRSAFLVTEKEQEYRAVLLDAMSKAGFVNNPEKWWHYSYGDQAWAQATAAKGAMYGMVKHPEEKDRE